METKENSDYPAVKSLADAWNVVYRSPSYLAPVPTPSQIFAKAKQRIFHQDNALKQLSVALHYHLKNQRDCLLYHEQQTLNRLSDVIGREVSGFELDNLLCIRQAPIFITGKTGSGKTHIIKELCQLYDVNFLAINATHISNMGFKGMDLSNIGDMLMNRAGKNRFKAMCSVIFLDEFDKLFTATSSTLAEHSRQVLAELLTIIEGSGLFPIGKEDGLDTSRMLFILGGSFGFHQKSQNSIGFMDNHDPQKLCPNTQLELSDYGFPDELAGRIGSLIALQALDKMQMLDILKNSPTSPIAIARTKLATHNCEIEFDDDFLGELYDNQLAATEKFGVRGLYQGFNDLPFLTDLFFEIAEQTDLSIRVNKDGYRTSPKLSLSLEEDSITDKEKLLREYREELKDDFKLIRQLLEEKSTIDE